MIESPSIDRRTKIKEHELLHYGISIVIPAFNEEQGIRSVLRDVEQMLAGLRMPSDVIVVDDGSSDRTAEIVGEFEKVILVQHPSNRGYGAALKTGILQSNNGLICIADADGTYPIRIIPELISAIKPGHTDMVVGARIGDEVAIPWLRRPAKWVIGKLANLIAGENIPDLNSGLRIFNRSTALKFFNLLPNGFSFTTTITLALFSNGYLIEYLPISYFKRIGKSKIRPVEATLNFILLVLRISLYFEPLKIFIPIGAGLMMLGLLWGLSSALLLGRFADVSTLIIVTTSIQVSVIGLLAELINRRLPNYHRNGDM